MRVLLNLISEKVTNKKEALKHSKLTKEELILQKSILNELERKVYSLQAKYKASSDKLLRDRIGKG